MSDFITVAELRIEAERLCDENERLEAENAKLRNDADLLRAMLSQERLEKQCYMAENAELQETLQRRTEQFEDMTEMWVVRGVENANLRELVRDMWRTMGLLNACDVSEYDEPLNCIYCEQWGNVGKNIVGCKLMYRMDELRIETD
jgi:hypothetical protein